jgi:hypothetical protein
VRSGEEASSEFVVAIDAVALLERASMMTKIAPLGLAIALSLVGCADSTRAGDDDTGGDGSGSGSQEPQPDPQMDAQGTYRINSTFDIVTNMPGGTGSFINGLIDATDDPDDPMSWLVDQMLAQMDDGTLKDLLVGVKPFVIDYLNDKVIDLAPNLVGTIDELGDRMNELLKEFGVNEKLLVNLVDQTFIGQITADGVRFKIAGATTDLLFAQHDIDDVVVPDILITLSMQSKLGIGEHTLSLPYGKIVRLGLDAAVIPMIDPTATSLAGLLDNVVDCSAVGQQVSNALGFGAPALFAGACLAGLDAAADAVYEQIAASDTKLDFHLVGSARGIDLDNDFKLDELSSGTWTGSMHYSGTPAPLGMPASFVGKRM